MLFGCKSVLTLFMKMALIMTNLSYYMKNQELHQLQEKLHDKIMKDSNVEKYLGDIISSKGTLDETIRNRKLKGYSYISDIRALLGKGSKKKKANYPLLVDKGSSKVDKRLVGEGRRGWIKKTLNVNIINFKKVYKPRRVGVGQCG